MRSEKWMPSPTFKGPVISKSTPLADTFWVNASSSRLPADTTTGKLSGKRTAQRTSWLGEGAVYPGIRVKPDFKESSITNTEPRSPIMKAHRKCSPRGAKDLQHE